ncbi:Flp family type IVb pilin [Sphingomonas sp. R1]|uniref:Flp family type IVb pilin n=1 Tax=Sphingomonas sp. R1 TaxID=399176 RepID=UPI0022256D0C|nr:Flp family type IVb pilin [Sphingomonas sp. R1]UYY77672.1 Flp family type IVb pilin [Sphingomonas sp. R1]
MRALIHLLRALASAQRGATAVEYGLVVALIVLAMIAGLTSLGNATGQLWGNMSQKVQQAG